MGNLVVSNMVSLDGFFEGPNRELNWHVVDGEFFDYAKDMLHSAEVLLFGRLTYQLMANYWPAAPKDEIADKMNGLPKIVFSRTLKKADWNNTSLVKNNVVDEVAKLKRDSGKDLVLLGSATLASVLLQAGLIDEYRIIMNPVLLGAGNTLFPGVKQRMEMKLEKARLFKSGVAVLYYEPA